MPSPPIRRQPTKDPLRQIAEEHECGYALLFQLGHILDLHKFAFVGWRRIGLALSGGGARGFAHLGAIRALEDCGFRPDIVAGVSLHHAFETVHTEKSVARHFHFRKLTELCLMEYSQNTL